MRKISILFIFLLILQGCSISKKEPLSIPLPKNISNPSALVLVDSTLSVLEMNGTITPLKIINAAYSLETYKTETKFYFLTNQTILNTLWVYDKTSKSIKCLIPRVASVQNINISSITEDESYMIYWTYQTSKEYGFDYIMHLYSIKKNTSLAIPKKKGYEVLELLETIFPDQFLITMQKSNTKEDSKNEIYLWNAVTKKKKFITTCDQYAASKDSKWLATVENGTLNRYSLENGQKEILKEKIEESQLEWIGSKPYLVTCEKSYLSGPSRFSYISPEKKWTDVSFEPFDKINKFYSIKSKLVLFEVVNRLSKNFKIICWNPDNNETKILYRSNQVDLNFDRITDNGTYIEFKGKSNDNTKNCFVIINTEEQKAKEFFNLLDYAYPVSFDESIWLFSYAEDKNNPEKEKEFVLYDWKIDKQYDLKVDWKGKVYSGESSNDGQYMNFSTSSSSENLENKTVFLAVQPGKEVSVPKANNMDFITWLE
jgi:hypothetical protein